jgi:UDP-glucose:(heptosyl)LPS alpha-1,3-glucosyltransferase
MMVHTELVKNDIRSRFRVPPEKIEVIYPGYNPADFSVNASARERIRLALGIGVNQILVGLITSGSFKKRNIELFLKATAEVAKKSPNLIKVLVLGKRATISAHQKLKTEAGLTSAILMEAVTNVDEYFQALDIFVLPAHIEEFGRVVLEAMVYGLPVVVSDRVGGSEILEGLSREGIFKAGNQDLLVNKIYRLVTDTPYRQKMGDQNRQTAQNYTEDIQIEKFADILVKHKLIPPSAEMGP